MDVGSLNPESTTRHIYTYENAPQADPYRVEIKENAKGEPVVSVRATADEPADAVLIATGMYQRTLAVLGGENYEDGS